ncbi:hypothetical protein [Agrobacterium pusense]|uniref:hypothetical protein n=1 Tax=Agrobacterium pusense TaxID=648995 RepID=UPI0013AF259E
MSSAQKYGPISSHDLNMLQSLLADAGFEIGAYPHGDRSFNKAFAEIDRFGFRTLLSRR